MKSVAEIVKEFYFTHAFPKYDNKGFRYDIMLDDERRGLKKNIKTLQDNFGDIDKVIISDGRIKKFGDVDFKVWAYFYDYFFLGRGWPPSKKRVDFVNSIIGESLKEKEKIEVLDVGCGEQPVTYALDSIRVYKVGADISETALKRALDSEYIQEAWFLDFNKIKQNELPDRKFDYIVMSEVLEHTSEPKEVIRKFSHLLKDEGSLIVTIPNPTCVAFLTDFLIHGFHLKKYYLLNRSHNPLVNSSSLESTIESLNNNGELKDSEGMYKLEIVRKENRPAKLYGFFPRDNTPLDKLIIKWSHKNPELFSFQFFYEIRKEEV